MPSQQPGKELASTSSTAIPTTNAAQRPTRKGSSRAPSPKSTQRSNKPIPLSARPKWDDTPLRPRPPALRGLSNFGSEPWARDEIVYNRRFRTWSDFTGYFDVEERSPYAPTRMLETEQRQVRYMDRWNQKYMVCSHPVEPMRGHLHKRPHNDYNRASPRMCHTG